MSFVARKSVQIWKSDGTLNEDPAVSGLVENIMRTPIGVYMSANRATAIVNQIMTEFNFERKEG